MHVVSTFFAGYLGVILAIDVAKCIQFACLTML
jgi:hypothetical protein